MNWIKKNLRSLSKKNKSCEHITQEMSNSNKSMTPIYKGKVKLNVGIGRVAFALIDIDSKMRWVNRLTDHHLIDGDIFGIEYSTYESYNLAWPISNRDYVLKAKWTIDKNAKTLKAKLNIASISHEKYPLRSDRVRGNLESLIFHLNEIDSRTTEVLVEIQVDPKGRLPKFLVNQIQKKWPQTTLKALSKEVSQGVEVHELFL